MTTKKSILVLLVAVAVVIMADCTAQRPSRINADQATVTGLTGNWTYSVGGQQGKAEIQQTGNKVKILGTWLPDVTPKHPGPHTIVTATISGKTLTGNWVCNQDPSCKPPSQGFRFSAAIDVDAGNKVTAVRVLDDTEDTLGYHWHGRVFTPAK